MALKRWLAKPFFRRKKTHNQPALTGPFSILLLFAWNNTLAIFIRHLAYFLFSLQYNNAYFGHNYLPLFCRKQVLPPSKFSFNTFATEIKLWRLQLSFSGTDVQKKVEQMDSYQHFYAHKMRNLSKISKMTWSRTARTSLVTELPSIINVRKFEFWQIKIRKFTSHSLCFTQQTFLRLLNIVVDLWGPNGSIPWVESKVWPQQTSCTAG